MSLFTRCAVALGGAALVVASVATATSAAADPVATDPVALGVSTNLTPINGWQAYGFGTRAPSVSKANGVVTLEGAISTTGTNSAAFVLPAGYRPSANVYAYVDLCNATNGRLLIETDGTAFVQAATFSNAQCFTSLEGVSFTAATTGYTNLTLINGWTGAQFGTRTPAAKVTNGVVTLAGSVETPTSTTNSEPFVLPKAFRPKTVVYAKVDMCNATNGRLIISPDGTTNVEAETDFSNAQCFTSLEGVSYAINSTSFTAIPTINGWTAGGFSTRPVAGKLMNGVVHLAGSIETTGTNTQAFRLPGALRPNATVYAPTDMCGATNGRIIISTNGFVSVAAETDFSNAQCFVSLEGVVFRHS